jgi:hypothetical protein
MEYGLDKATMLIQELARRYNEHLDDAESGHEAESIGVDPVGNLESENVQDALEELQESIDTINTNTPASPADLADSSDIAKGDALVAYKAPLTSSVARTVHDRFIDFAISVKDFGATGDGTTNDAPAIALAIAAASSGQAIYFPQGTYRCSTGFTPTFSGTRFFGDGYNSAIKADAGVLKLFNMVSLTNIKFNHLTFIGSETTEVGSQALRFDTCSRFEVDGCQFTGIADATGFNIHIALATANSGKIGTNWHERCVGTNPGNGYGILVSTNSHFNRVDNNYLDFTEGGTYGGRHAIYVSSGSSYNTVSGNQSTYCENDAITHYTTTAQSTSYGNVIRDNVITRCGRDSISIVENIQDCIVEGNIIRLGVRNGIYLEAATAGAIPTNIKVNGNIINNIQQCGILCSGANDSSFNDNIIGDVSLGSATTYPGIQIDAASGPTGGFRNELFGNSFKQVSATAARSGIKIGSNATDTRLGPNQIATGNLTLTQYEDQGSPSSTIYVDVANTTTNRIAHLPNASSVTHYITKDESAGTTTTSVTFAIGNKGSNAGTLKLRYTNAAAAGAPQVRINFDPRNNADTTEFNCVQQQFDKVAGNNGGNYTLKTSTTGGTLSNAIFVDETQKVYVYDHLRFNTLGKGLQIKEGSNAKMGVATLSGGSATVNTTAITGSSRVFLTVQSFGTNMGVIYLGTVNAGTSFVINSTDGASTSVVAWMIVEAV